MRVTRASVAALQKTADRLAPANCGVGTYCTRPPLPPMIDPFREGDPEPPKVICRVCGLPKLRILVCVPADYVEPESDCSEWRPGPDSGYEDDDEEYFEEDDEVPLNAA